MFLRSKFKKILSILLTVSILITNLFSNGPFLIEAMASYKDTVERSSDPITMDQYRILLNLDQSSRKAGGIWADKTVIANGTVYKGSSETGDEGRNFNKNVLALNRTLDGVSGNINIGDDDFLHVYSILGSSQEVIGMTPTRTVIVFDNSGSMYNSSNGKITENGESVQKTDEELWHLQRIALTVEAIDRAIDTLMEANAYNEVAVVLFGDGTNSGSEHADTMRYRGQETAVTVLPMKHYDPIPEGEEGRKEVDPASGNKGYTPYLTGGWDNGAEPDGAHPYHNGTSAISNGWVFVDNELCKLQKSNTNEEDNNIGHEWYKGSNWQGWNKCNNNKYTAYRNGPTNIQAGYYVGLQELLSATSEQKVGSMTFQCVPSMVILTDGQATDMMSGNFINPELEEENSEPKKRGFLNDTGNKLRSFTGVTNSKDKEIANFWDMFVEIGKDGKYQSVAWHEGINKSETDLQKDPVALEQMKKVAKDYSNSVASMLLGTIMTAAYYKEAVRRAYKVEKDWNIYTVSVDMIDPGTMKGTEAAAAIASDGNPNPKTELPSKWAYDITSNAATMSPSKYFYKDGKVNIDWLSQKGYLDSGVNLTDILNSDDADVIGKTVYPDYSVGEMLIQGIVTAAKTLQNYIDLKETKTSYRSWSEVKGILKDTQNWELDESGDPIKRVEPWKHDNGYLLQAEEEIIYPHLTGAEDKSINPMGLTTQDIIDNIAYDHLAYYASTTNGSTQDLVRVFVEIMDTITEPLFAPINGTNDLGVENAVTYVDPLGKYMEVKDVKNLVLFGENHTITKTALYSYEFITEWNKLHGDGSFQVGWYSSDDASEAYYIGSASEAGNWDAGNVYLLNGSTAREFVSTLDEDHLTPKQQQTLYTFYRIADLNSDERAQLRKNPVYGTEEPKEGDPGAYRLNEIRIWVEDTGDYNDSLVDDSGMEMDVSYDEALFINIPEAALPLRTAMISYDESNNISYSSNVDSGSSGKYQDLPLRVFYTVGISDELIQDGNINLANVSRQYLEKYQSDGKVTFLSNWYSEQTYDGYVTTENRTRGDAAITFSVDANNRYYIFQKPLLLYKAPGADANEEIIFSDDEEMQAFIGSHEKVTDRVDSESYYYVIGEYFKKIGPNSGAKVYVAVTRKGSEFGSGIGDHATAASLVWYNETTGATSEYNSEAPDQGKPLIAPEQWAAATKPGGLRLGDMAQNIISKKNNKTNTSYNVLLPTVSTSTDSTDPNLLIVNYYLGNNGLLKTEDSMLLVTKEVLTDKSIEKPSDQFKFSVHIDGKKGIVGAVKCIWDGETYDALTTDYVMTDNNGYILFADGTASGFELKGTSDADRLITDGCVTLASGEELNVLQYDEDGQPVYQITSIFDTQDVEFDPDGNAEISLGHGEGLLFMGLHAGTSFRIEEDELTKEQEDKGFTRAYAYFTDEAQEDSMLLSGSIGTERVKEAHFVNEYEPRIEVSLKGKKTVKTEEEYELSEGAFKFILTPSPENPDGDPITEIQTLENDPDGAIQILNKAEYKKVGTYDYTLHEEIDESLSGIVWDDSVYEIAVDIKIDEDDPSVLASDITVLKDGEPYEEEITFENQYKKDKTSVIISGSKILDNAVIKDYSFTFKLEPVSVNPLAEEEMVIRSLLSADLFDIRSSQNVMTPSNYVITPHYTETSSNSIPVPRSTAVISSLAETSSNALEDIPMPEDGKDVAESTTTGEFQFGKIVFMEEGVYTYQITEESSDIPGMVYDTTVYQVVVTVKKDKDGMLQATMKLVENSQAADSLLFENIYTFQSIEFTPKVKKTISGNPPASRKELFQFELETSKRYIPGAYLPSNTTATVRGDGEAVFEPITITKEGFYEFVIHEEPGEGAGYQYDSSEWTIKVETELDPGEETPTLRIKSVEYISNDPETPTSEEFASFKNIYTTTQTTKQLKVEKLLTGEPTPEDKTFTFTLSARADNPSGATLPAVNQKTISGTGTVDFDQIVFTKTGTFWFDIKEESGSEPGYDYDSAAWSVKVVVEDNDSKLQVSEVTYLKDGEEQSEEKAVFTNNYHVTPVSYTPVVSKQITGENYPENKIFEFTIKRLDEKPGVTMEDMERITIDGAGRKSFKEISFTKAGTYTFEISESEGSEKGYSYDTVPYILTVVVEDEDSALTVQSHTYTKRDNSKTNTGAAVFVNRYSVESVSYVPKVRKSIIGAVTPVDKEFTFNLSTEESDHDITMPSDTSTVVSGEGTAEFGSILFKRAGTYTFEITEDKGTHNGYTYSDDIWTLTVEVEDIGGSLNIKKTSYTLGETTSEEEALFTNTYSVTETSFQIPVEKNITGENRPVEKPFVFVMDSLNGLKSGFELPDDRDVTITGIGKTSFAPIKFTEAGVYSFSVTENDTKEDGYTYDTAKWTVDITVSDTDSILKVTDILYKKDKEEVPSVSAAVFENAYHVTETSFAPEVEKVITGADTPTDKEFTFTITANEEYGSKVKMPVDDLVITGSKKEAFDAITFYSAGTYEFTIKEETGTDAGYSYDPSSWKLTVTVTDTGSILSAKGKYEKDGVSHSHAKFENTYSVSPIDCVLAVEKQITGDERPQETDFTFVVTEAEDYGDSVVITNDKAVINGSGTKEFTPITFKAAGTYGFEIREQNSGKDGYSYSNDVWNVEVTVSDTESILSVDTVTYSKNNTDSERTSALFENEYHVTPTTYIPQAEKRLTGEEVPEEKEFMFSLIPEKQYDGIEMNGEISEAKRKGSGYVSFDEITFTKSGTYRFRITENQGTDNGYSYSKDEWILTVVVEDIDSLLTKTKITYSLESQEESHAIFTNDYQVTPAELVIPVEKTISGDPTPVNKKFSFVLSKKKDDKNGVVLPKNTEITIEGAGNSAFEPVSFTKAGDYSLQVRETAGTDHGYSYDGSVWTVTVTVKDMDSTLTVTDVKYQKDGKDTENEKTLFANLYSVTNISFTPQVVKTVSGERTPVDKVFHFKLVPKEDYKDIVMYAADGETEVKEGQTAITGSGAAAFGKVLFKKAGSYEFDISEEKGSDAGYAYDDTVWTLNVEVENEDGYLKVVKHSYTDGEKVSDTEAAFENIYSVKPVEYVPCAVKKLTGDPTPVDKPFIFKLSNASGDSDGFKLPDEDITILGVGEKSWEPIAFTKAGTYRFMIGEEPGSDSGYGYDSHEWILTVDIEDIEGELHVKSAEYKRDDDVIAKKAEFTNDYKVKKTSYAPKVKKILDGEPDEDRTFQFKLTPKEKCDNVTVLNDMVSITGAGENFYEGIVFRQAGTYEFTIRELELPDRNYDYDESVWTLTVIVEDVESQLTVTSAAYSASGTVSEENAVFTNRYTKPGRLVIEKHVTGSGNKKQNFTFDITLTDRNGQPLSGDYLYEKQSQDNEETILETGMITDGTEKVELKHGQSVSLTLPYGTMYTVSEAEADKNGYVTTVSVNEEMQDTDVVNGTIVSDETDTVLFQNKKNSGKSVTASGPKWLKAEPVITDKEPEPVTLVPEQKESVPEPGEGTGTVPKKDNPRTFKNSASIPKAGDPFDFALSEMALILSGCVLFVGIRKRKRKTKDR